MRINTNVASLNAQRILGNTGAAAAKSIGRLSSGFRINSASDDAAGLGIANKLRSDLRSLTQASRNAEQATAMLQVAEGAAQTIGNILDRMKELAAQSASSNSGDRGALQTEFNTLRTEITRIVDTTQYQGRSLINGTLGNRFDAAQAGSTLDSHAGVQASTIQANGAAAGTYTIARVSDTRLSMTDGSGNVQTVDVATTGEQTVNFSRFGLSFRTATGFDASVATVFDTNNSVEVVAGSSAADFLVSSSGQYTGNDLVSMSSSINLSAGAGGLNIAAADISAQDTAQSALTAIDNAVTSLNSALSTIGATQNRIEFAAQNVKSTIQNFAAAESTIRDADMAAEMSTFTKQQILQQAGVAMLAQANSAPQQVLRLLQ